MKIAYLFNSRIPTEKAHGLQIMQMCDAFARNGHDVTLVVPRRRNPIKESPWAYYGLEQRFRIVYMPVIDTIRWDALLGKTALWLSTAMYGIVASLYLKKLKPDLVYSRDTSSAFWVPRKLRHIFEAHTFPKTRPWLYRMIWRRNDRIVVMTEGLKNAFLQHGFPEEKLLVAHDAVNLEKFRVMESKRESRAKLNLPLDDFLVTYIGRPYKEQGIETLRGAAASLPVHIKVIIVGADDNLEPCLTIGRVPHAEIPSYLNAADLVVMPYTGQSEHVAKYASPMKLFEYLAAGKAIVTSDLPSIREVLDEDSAEFVPPDDAKALYEKILNLSQNPSRIAGLENAAKRIAAKYSWSSRADTVLQGVPRTVHEKLWTWCRRYRVELGILVGALLLRLLYVVFFPQHNPHENDSGIYLGLADAIRGAIPWTNQPDYFQPGYPYLLAVLRSVSENHFFVRFVQTLISTGTVALMMVMAGRWMSRKAGIYAGMLAALSVPMILDTGVLLTETTFAFLLTLGVYLFLRALECRRCVQAIYAGAALALAGFVREIGYYFAAVLVLYAGFFRRTWRVAVTILVLAFFSAGIISLQSRVTQESISSGAPVVGKGYEQTVFNDVTFKKNAYALERLTMYPEGMLRYFLLPYRLIDVSDGTAVKQAVLQKDMVILKTVWPQLFAKSFLVLFHWLIIGLAIFGLWRGKAPRDLKFVLSLLILFAGGTIVFASVGRPAGFDVYEPLARYRFPVEPLIIVLAAAGIERFMNHKKPA